MNLGDVFNWLLAHPALGVIVLLIVVALFAVLVRQLTRAAKEGRSVRVGPVEVGESLRRRHDDNDVVTAGVPRRPGISVGDSADERDNMYTVAEAAEFYNKIASQYDTRNSGPLLGTHLLTKKWIYRSIIDKEKASILDLGGGTGREIATYFEQYEHIDWTYVDFSSKMADQFRANLSDNNVRMRIDVHIEDIRYTHRSDWVKSYDVILLSVVLSSMQAHFNISDIANLVHPGGTLIISEIDPLYTERNPLYRVTVGAETYSLRTSPVQPHEVAAQALAAGLTHIDTATIRKQGACYSFVSVFQRLPLSR
jgi:SAM-dependent methyltransferase